MSAILVSSEGLWLSEDDLANIREALYLAADHIEDIDNPEHYEPGDLESIAREAESYRALAGRLLNYTKET